MKKNNIIKSLFYFIPLFFIFGVVVPNGLFWVFDSKTQYLKYEELPQGLKSIILEYKIKAQDKGVDVSALNHMTYILYDETKGSHGGFGFYKIPVMGISYNPKNGYLFNKSRVWHEFGHIFLGYGHEGEVDHIMNYKTHLNSYNQKKLEKVYFEKEVSYFNLKTVYSSAKAHLSQALTFNKLFIFSIICAISFFVFNQKLVSFKN